MLGLLSVLPLFLAPLDKDPVTFSFVFFGCNRVDKSDWHRKENPSSANLPQLRRTFKDIENIKPMPKILFAVGDLVLGYKDDGGAEVRSQLDAWIAEYRTSSLRGKIALVPMSGNHEVNVKVGDDRKESLATTAIWNDWIKTNHLMPTNPNGPKAGGPDNLADDQSTLNFSFDAGGMHFVCLNTDTRVSSGIIGYVPANWANEDIKKASLAGKPTFVLGHRNIVAPETSKGDAPIEPESGSLLIKGMESGLNVIGYLCAHVHAWDVTKVSKKFPLPFQIVAGNGGSPLEKDWNPSGGTTYGFALIEAHKSGLVTLTPYFRPAKDVENPEPAKPQKPIVLGTTKLRKGLVKPRG